MRSFALTLSLLGFMVASGEGRPPSTSLDQSSAVTFQQIAAVRPGDVELTQPATARVGIARSAYVCDLDRQRFGEPDDFLMHLTRQHQIAPATVPGVVYLRDGLVHYPADVRSRSAR